MTLVTKEDGQQESFDDEKLRRSLQSANVSADVTEDVIVHVKKDLKDGMSTERIYEHARSVLEHIHRPFAASYSLKRSLIEFGPTGFPFERFLGKVLETQGYQVKVGVQVKGACVSHEVDVVAEKQDERLLVEAKFHHSSGLKTDVKVALYVHARFTDIANKAHQSESEIFQRAWLITNTHFTSQAIEYGKCAGLYLTGWNYPKGRTLQDLIESARVHPLTCLTTLSSGEKRTLLDRGAVLCKDILSKTDMLAEAGLSKSKIEEVLKEGAQLCTP